MLKRLAVGGMAELFLAKDTKKDRLVVLKRILPYLAEEGEFVRMFLDEARIAASLHHPSIVELYELGHLEGSTFIAMEWVDGIDLRRILQKEQERGGVVPPGVAAWFVARLCEGLQHAHSARDASGQQLGIIHRDVSPQNVMVSFRGEVKLVDFGIAKATAWMSRSKPGVIKGKFLYLAPEQLTTDPLDHRMDLFSLGTMLYELTTGQSPFYRTSTEAVIYAIRMEDPDPPTKIRRGFPPALEKIILKCLVKERSRRYQSAAEIGAALERFMRDEAPTSRDDASHYVWSMFGDDSERTGIFIPENARSDTRTDTSTQRDRRPRPVDDERTRPALAPVRPGPPVPEGRRETGELQNSDNNVTRPERLRVRPAPAAASNPWEPEVTAPMPRESLSRAPVKRDYESTAEIGGSIEPTSVSMAGERDLEVGEVFKPLMPTWQGDSAPQLTRLAPPSPPPAGKIRAVASKPPPPIPSYDSIPEVSVVSAGEATVGELLNEVREPSYGDLEPLPPPSPPQAPSTRAPPRKREVLSAPPQRKPPKLDPDDYIETVDQGFDAPRPDNSSKVFIAIFGVALLIVVVLVAWLLWANRAPDETTPRPVTPRPKVRDEVRTPGLVKVQVQAPKGTALWLGDKPLIAEQIFDSLPGDLVVKFVCPAKKKGQKQQAPSSLTASIPSSDRLVVVKVKCE
ncbi:MAG: serine/threonine protein kinase [Archangium sp.]